MSTARTSSGPSVSPPSPQPDPVELSPKELSPKELKRGGSEGRGVPRRGRGGTQRGLVRPRCPEHGGEMLVGRTVGSVQYRYCTVEGCTCATTTFRSDAPHKRWPPASHLGGGAAVEGVTIIPQESPVAPGEWPVGRPVPGQSS